PELAEDRQRHHRPHVVLGPEAGHVHRGLQRQHHAGEQRGGEGDGQRPHPDDVDLAGHDPKVGRRQGEVAGHPDGEQPEPAVPDRGLAEMGSEILLDHRSRSSEKLSTSARNAGRPASKAPVGATYRKSCTQGSARITRASTVTSRPSAIPRTTEWAASRPPTVVVPCSITSRFVSPKGK